MWSASEHSLSWVPLFLASPGSEVWGAQVGQPLGGDTMQVPAGGLEPLGLVLGLLHSPVAPQFRTAAQGAVSFLNMQRQASAVKPGPHVLTLVLFLPSVFPVIKESLLWKI